MIPFTLLFSAAIHSEAGSVVANFLKITPTARIAAVADAFYAGSSDIGMLTINPSGLEDETIAGFTHNDYIENMRYNYIGYIKNGFGVAALGLFINSDLERRSQTVEDINTLTEPEGFFGGRSVAFLISRAINIKGKHMGATVKIIEETIDDKSAYGVGFDIATLLKKGKNRFAFGVHNFGPAMRFIERYYNLPLAVKAGFARYEKNIKYLSELTIPVDNYPKIAAGIEYEPLNFFSLRTGYKYRYHGQELEGYAGVAIGAGFKIRGFTIDYSFQPFGELGSSHKFTLSYNFKIEPALTRKPSTTKITLINYSTYTVVVAEPLIDVPLKKIVFYTHPIKEATVDIDYTITDEGKIIYVKRNFKSYKFIPEFTLKTQIFERIDNNWIDFALEANPETQVFLIK